MLIQLNFILLLLTTHLLSLWRSPQHYTSCCSPSPPLMETQPSFISSYPPPPTLLHLLVTAHPCFILLACAFLPLQLPGDLASFFIFLAGDSRLLTSFCCNSTQLFRPLNSTYLYTTEASTLFLLCCASRLKLIFLEWF